MLNLYASLGQTRQVERVFSEMQLQGFAPQVIAYNTLLKAYQMAKLPDKAEEVLRKMLDIGQRPTAVTLSYLRKTLGPARYKAIHTELDLGSRVDRDTDQFQTRERSNSVVKLRNAAFTDEKTLGHFL
eukprot:UN0787